MPETALCRGRAAVDDWVAANVCTAADFLSGPMRGDLGLLLDRYPYPA